MTNWIEKLRNGDIAINEVKEDCFLSTVIVNLTAKECIMMAGPYTYMNPTRDDILSHFIESGVVIDFLHNAGVTLKSKSVIIGA